MRNVKEGAALCNCSGHDVRRIGAVKGNRTGVSIMGRAITGPSEIGGGQASIEEVLNIRTRNLLDTIDDICRDHRI